MVAGRYQCAETQSTARGRGRSLPMDAQPSVQGLWISAFIGLPCPKKMAGIGFVMRCYSLLINSNSPEIDVGRQGVPVVEGVRIVRFVSQFVVSRRQRDYHIDLSVLTRAACMCGLG